MRLARSAMWVLAVALLCLPFFVSAGTYESEWANRCFPYQVYPVFDVDESSLPEGVSVIATPHPEGYSDESRLTSDSKTELIFLNRWNREETLVAGGSWTYMSSLTPDDLYVSASGWTTDSTERLSPVPPTTFNVSAKFGGVPIKIRATIEGVLIENDCENGGSPRIHGSKSSSASSTDSAVYSLIKFFSQIFSRLRFW